MGKDNLEKKNAYVVQARLMQKNLSKGLCAQKTAQIIIRLEGKVKNEKRARKGTVYMTVS